MNNQFKAGDAVYVKAKILETDKKSLLNLRLSIGDHYPVWLSDKCTKIKKIKLKKNFTVLEEGCYYKNNSKMIIGPLIKRCEDRLGNPVYQDSSHVWVYDKQGLNVAGYCLSEFNLIEKVDIVRSKG